MPKLDQTKNFSKAQTSILHNSAATSITLDASEGGKLPDPAIGNYNLTWHDKTNFPDPSDDPSVEIVRVTDKVGDVLTVVRGQEGTVATDKNTPSAVYQFLLTPTDKFRLDIQTELQTQNANYAIATGTANAIVLTLDPAPTAYVDGVTYKFQSSTTNTTTTVTIDVNGLGAKTIRNPLGQTNLLNGEITSDRMYEVMFIASADTMILLSNNIAQSDLSNNSFDGATAVFSANDYALTLTRPIDGAGQDAFANSVIRFVAPANNTGAVTVTINGNVDSVLKQNGDALEVDDIISGDVVEIARRTTAGAFQLMSAGVTSQSAPQIQFVFAYDTTTQAVSVANTFQDVTFSNNQEIDGWTHTPTSADFIANLTGKYNVDMGFLIEDTGAGTPLFEFIGLVNGTEVPGSQLPEQASVNNLQMKITHNFDIDITAAQIFKIQMTATTTNAQITTAGANATTAVSASVTITRI